MKNLLQNFSLDVFLSLPPTEMLAVVILGLLAVYLVMMVIGGIVLLMNG